MFKIALLVFVLQSIPVVTPEHKLAWDYTLNVAPDPPIVDEFRIYLSRSPGVVPDGTPEATVAVPSLEWGISVPNGVWRGCVTAFDGDADLDEDGVAEGVESECSNEVVFFVLGPPSNPRVVLVGDIE